jgi:hypothetical protein
MSFLSLKPLDEGSSKMKNLNVVITEESDKKLEKIMAEKRFRNRADALDWIIPEAFKIVFPEAAEEEAGR